MSRKFLNDRDLLDHAIDQPRDGSCPPEENDPRLQDAAKFINMVRESSFAPFKDIEPAPRFLEKQKASAIRRKKIFVLSGLSAAGIAAMIAVALISGIVGISPRSTLLVSSGEVLINNNRASAGSYIKEGDSVTTGRKAFAVILYSDKVTVSLGENSGVTVSGLAGGRRPGMTVNQSYGSSFTSIRPGSADFTIRSHSTAVTVHGTAFSFTCGPEGTGVKLLRGKVAVSRFESGKTVELNAGQSIVSNSAGISTPVSISPDEKTFLTALDDMADKVLKNSRLEDIPLQAEQILEENRFAADGSGGPLTEISGKYGRISVVETRNGEKFTGAVSYHDKSIMVITPKGSVTVPLSDISRIAPYTD